MIFIKLPDNTAEMILEASDEVEENFLQLNLSGDYEKVDTLPISLVYPFGKRYKYEKDEIVPDDTRNYEDEYREKVKEIQEYIYSVYSKLKQDQDEKYVTSYTTTLKAKGQKENIVSFQNLESFIVSLVKKVLSGDPVDEVIDKNYSDYDRKLIKKLIKISIRTHWLENTIEEGKLAIIEKRNPSYQDFPSL